MLEAQKYQTITLTAKEAVNTVVEQGLWVSLMINMAGICGKLYKDNDDDFFLYEQRKMLIDVLETLTNKDLTGNILGFGKIPNPGYYLFGLLRPLLHELKRHEHEGALTYYKQVAPIPMMVLVFQFPGLLKLLSTQLGEILPG